VDPAYLSALSALAGSIVGGLTSGLGGWLNQRAQTRAQHLDHEISRREELYKDFIVAASKAYGEAILSNEPQIQDFVALYAMVSRMRVVSSPQTVECADKIMRMTIETYYAPNRTLRQIHEIIKSGTDIDPLKEFSEVARAELRHLASA
jgi:hypothetical protein